MQFVNRNGRRKGGSQSYLLRLLMISNGGVMDVKDLLVKQRGLFFDALVLLANLLLVGPLTELVRSTEGFHPLFGFLLIAAVFAYSIGAWLKARPLQSRLAKRSEETAFGFFVLLFILFVMHLGLFIACLSFALAILKDSGFGAWAGTDAAAITALMLGCSPTVLALWAIIPAEQARSPNQESACTQELIADFAIYLALIVLLAWWNGVFVEMVATLPPQHWIMEIILSVLMTVPFAMFYLAPRILFLVEDYRAPLTWITIALAVSPLVLRNYL